MIIFQSNRYFNIFMNYSNANDIDIQKQLDVQKEIINEQAKRIDQLEIIIEELKKILPRSEINNATINTDKKMKMKLLLPKLMI